jgi:ketosteroid isomerase-like protein
MKADAKTEAEVLATLDQFWEAYAKRDLVSVIALLAPDPDLSMFGTGADERRVGLREWVAQMERDWSQSEAMWVELGWRSVSAAGQVAWVSADCVIHYRTNKVDGTMSARLTVVFERRDGKWLMIHMHGSAPLGTQAEGESFPTSIDAVAAAVQRERPDLRGRAAPDGTITLLFTDIEGSTAINERLGDQRWLELLRGHNVIVREQGTQAAAMK